MAAVTAADGDRASFSRGSLTRRPWRVSQDTRPEGYVVLDRRVFYPTGGGHGVDQVDLQPCGGTQVARTGEIRALRLGKIEKKGRRDLSLSVHLAG